MSWWLDLMEQTGLPVFVGVTVGVLFMAIFSAYWRANINEWTGWMGEGGPLPEVMGFILGLLAIVVSGFIVWLLPAILCILLFVGLVFLIYWPLVLLFKHVHIKVNKCP